MLSTILGILISWLLSALVIYVVGRLGLGLTVGSFTNALIAAAIIAIVSWIVTWLLGLIGIDIQTQTFWGAIVALVVAAVVLLISDRFLTGMQVNGFVGALVAAIAIAVVAWLVNWLLGVLGLGGADANPTTLLLPFLL
jgi:putative membrane protein